MTKNTRNLIGLTSFSGPYTLEINPCIAQLVSQGCGHYKHSIIEVLLNSLMLKEFMLKIDANSHLIQSCIESC